VEEGSGDGLLVEVELGADLRHGERMVDELLAGAPNLPTVMELGEVERAADQLPVDARVVALHDRDELVDEASVMAFGIDDCHGVSVLGGFKVEDRRLQRRT
jgi:hypothetical protein